MKVFVVHYLNDYSGWESELIAVTDSLEKAVKEAKTFMKEYGDRWERGDNEWFSGASRIHIIESEVI